MADSWFRFYNSAHDHPKIMMLSDGHFRSWTKLLSLASKCKGVIPNDIQLVSKVLGKPPGRAADTLQIMLSAVLFDLTDEGYVPHNWEKKQFKSDDSTPRVKRFRDKERNVSETDHRQRHSTEKKKEDIDADAFQAFWDSCPKKVGRGAAEKAWAKAVKLASPEKITAAMRLYAKKQAGKDQSYVKTPGPWLNDKRWEDEGASQAVVFEPASDIGWGNRVRVWRDGGGWHPKWGPDPNQSDCKCPPQILKDAA